MFREIRTNLVLESVESWFVDPPGVTQVANSPAPNAANFIHQGLVQVLHVLDVELR